MYISRTAMFPIHFQIPTMALRPFIQFYTQVDENILPNGMYDLCESNERARKRRVHEASQYCCSCGFGSSSSLKNSVLLVLGSEF